MSGPTDSKTFIRIRPDTRRKFDEVKRVKRLKFVEVADLAIDALLKSDPELRRAGRRSRGAVPA